MKRSAVVNHHLILLVMVVLIVFLLCLGCSSTVSAVATSKGNDYLSLKWNYTARERINGIYVGDLDGDGKKEIAAMGSIEGAIYVMNWKGEKLWKKSVFCPVYAINGVKWKDEDKYEDILLGSCTHAHLFSHDGEMKWQFFTQHGAARVLFPVDMNDDGEREILIGSGDPTSSMGGKNTLYLADKNGKLFWRVRLASAPYAVDVKDINADGKKDIIVGMVSSGLGFGVYRGRVAAYDEDGNFEWEVRVKSGIYSIKIDDLDKDGNFEIIAGSFPKVYVFDKKGREKWNYETGAHTYSLGVIEVNKRKQLVVGSNDIYLFNSNLEKKWKYDTDDEAYEIKVEDIDMDGTPEILVGSDRLYVISAEGKPIWSSKDLTTVKGIFSEDLEGDGYKEVIVGALDKNVYVFENEQYVKKQNAEKNLKKAEDAYEDGDYDGALAYAEKAKKIFDELKQKDKSKECEDLMKEIGAMKANDTKNKKEGDEYYNKSLQFYLEDKFKSALIFAKKAIEHYELLNKKDEEIEKTLENARSLRNNSLAALKLQAYAYYENSSELYELENYKAALDAAYEAESLYRWLNIAEMEKKAGEMMAKSFCALAKKELERNYLENASIHVNASLKKYEELGNNSAYQKDIKECNELKETIAKGGIIRSKGMEIFSYLPLLLMWSGIVLMVVLIILIIIRVVIPSMKKRGEKKHAKRESRGEVGEGEKGVKPMKNKLKEIKTKIEVEQKEEQRTQRKIEELSQKEQEGGIEEEAKESKEEGEEREKKPKVPKLEPIKKDKFRGVGGSLKGVIYN
jgi:outer membrane protein assembly factor BamB